MSSFEGIDYSNSFPAFTPGKEKNAVEHEVESQRGTPPNQQENYYSGDETNSYYVVFGSFDGKCHWLFSKGDTFRE